MHIRSNHNGVNNELILCQTVLHPKPAAEFKPTATLRNNAAAWIGFFLPPWLQYSVFRKMGRYFCQRNCHFALQVWRPEKSIRKEKQTGHAVAAKWPFVHTGKHLAQVRAAEMHWWQLLGYPLCLSQPLSSLFCWIVSCETTDFFIQCVEIQTLLHVWQVCCC